MVSTVDIAWLAGLLEGEGCLNIRKERGPSSITITVEMTDRDIVERVSKLWNSSLLGPYQRTTRKCKSTYVTSIHGGKAASWLMTVYMFLGERRQEKARELLNFWRQQTRKRMAECHPDRPRHGNGLCQKCYGKERRANQREAA